LDWTDLHGKDKWNVMNTWEQMHGWNGLYALEIIAWMGQMRYVGDLAWDGWYGMNKWIERMEG
jgi:hypothetical protein